MKRFVVDELEFASHAPAVAMRALGRGEVAEIRSQGYLTPEEGAPILFLVPASLLATVLPGPPAAPPPPA